MDDVFGKKVHKSHGIVRYRQNDNKKCRNFALSKETGASAYICRLPEPTRAHSREQHMQTPEAANKLRIEN